jgi:predicted Co/Zn/Cd cation transporter (cation efflux family)
MEAHEYAQGLREFADWIEEHAELLSDHSDLRSTTVMLCRIDREEFVELAVALDGEQDTDDRSHFSVIREFGGLTVKAFTNYEVVGTAIPRMREITEWELDPDVRVALQGSVKAA